MCAEACDEAAEVEVGPSVRYLGSVDFTFCLFAFPEILAVPSTICFRIGKIGSLGGYDYGTDVTAHPTISVRQGIGWEDAVGGLRSLVRKRI